ncbi:unnamed protein product [Prunus armeniaca]
MPENNDGAKVCAETHGDNCNDGSAGCINNEINNGAEGDGIHRLSRPAMAFTNPLSIISGHLYSTDDRLKRGRPPPFLKNACEDVAVGEEPVSSCYVFPLALAIAHGDMIPIAPMFLGHPIQG